MSRRTKSAGQGVLKHLHGRFDPAMILVEAKLFCFPAVHDTILAIQMRSLEKTDEDGGIYRGLGWAKSTRGRMGELVILYRLDAAAAGESGYEQHKGEGAEKFSDPRAGGRQS
jgi:hypothetical protein